MPFLTKKSSVSILQGQIVETASDPEKVQLHTTGAPLGVAMRDSGTPAVDEDGNVLHHTVKICFGGGDTPVEVTAPTGYDGQISRFTVGDNGVIQVTPTGGYGYLFGLNPTRLVWGT